MNRQDLYALLTLSHPTYLVQGLDQQVQLLIHATLLDPHHLQLFLLNLRGTSAQTLSKKIIQEDSWQLYLYIYAFGTHSFISHY